MKSLRVSARRNSKAIISHIIQTNISRPKQNSSNVQDLCMFCSSTDKLTKEHVIPRWTYENSTKRFFTTNINGLDQTYNKTTIPACSVCNNNWLSTLEKHINKIFSQTDTDSKYFSTDEQSNIIRWLEIIDYKFQILNARRIFTTSREKGFIPYLADIPLSILRPGVNYGPSKAISEIRRSHKRVTTKNKISKLNSLIMFKTSNKSFHFFHSIEVM